MIPGCHSVVASWDYVGVGCAYVVLASSWLWSLVFCWGASDSPPNPLSAQQQARTLVVASKALGHQSWWLGGVVATSFNLTPLEGWVNLGELVKDTRR